MNLARSNRWIQLWFGSHAVLQLIAIAVVYFEHPAFIAMALVTLAGGGAIGVSLHHLRDQRTKWREHERNTADTDLFRETLEQIDQMVSRIEDAEVLDRLRRVKQRAKELDE